MFTAAYVSDMLVDGPMSHLVAEAHRLTIQLHLDLFHVYGTDTRSAVVATVLRQPQVDGAVVHLVCVCLRCVKIKVKSGCTAIAFGQTSSSGWKR